MYGPPPDAPKATCPKCKTVYVDWADYSGPAHSQGECLAALVTHCKQLEDALGLLRAAAIPATLPPTDPAVAQQIKRRCDEAFDLLVRGVST